MKTLLSLFMAMTATLFLACNVPSANSALLKDETQRKAIISELVSNHDYTMQLMDSMHTNMHAKQMMMSSDNMKMMMGDTAMQKMMVDNMMHMMESDSMACMRMGEKMMMNEHMKSMMQGMMSNKHMMIHKGDMMNKK